MNHSPVTRICAQCGTEFEVTERLGRMPKYCRADACERARRAAYARRWYAEKRAEGMPAKQSNVVPCAGCGKPLGGGRGSLPAGRRRCRACRRNKSCRHPGGCPDAATAGRWCPMHY